MVHKIWIKFGFCRRNYERLRYARNCVCASRLNYKGKSVPLQACSDPEGSRKLRFPDYVTVAQDGDKTVSLKHRPSLSPGNTPGTHFC